MQFASSHCSIFYLTVDVRYYLNRAVEVKLSCKQNVRLYLNMKAW